MIEFNPDKPWETTELFMSWRVKGLLKDGSPLMDIGASAQTGYVGTAIIRDDDNPRSCWDYPKEDGSRTYMITSMTWGASLNLMVREGRNRAVDYICEKMGLHMNEVSTTHLFASSRRANRWKIVAAPFGLIHFEPPPKFVPDDPPGALSGMQLKFTGRFGEPKSTDEGIYKKLHIDGLAALDNANDDRRLPDGSRLVDALAVGIIATHFADEHDPEWRERYTSAWWAKQKK